MIPIRDNIRSRTTPVVNYAILWANVAVWAWQLMLNGDAVTASYNQFGLVPATFADPVLWESGQYIDLFFPFVSSMFMHGGWLHIIGNLWMLWIFGDNVEDYLGHGRYLLFYLLSGVGAGALHLLTNWGSPVPTVGASGAIAGIMGAYMLLYPRAMVLTYLPVFVVLIPLSLPAVVFIGFWFVMQFLSGTASLLQPTDGGGVAWWAHIGGFLVGIALLGLLGRGRARYRSKPPRTRMGRIQPESMGAWRRR